MSPFLAWGDFHARSRFARPTIPEEKWGTTRSLLKGGDLLNYKVRVVARGFLGTVFCDMLFCSVLWHFIGEMFECDQMYSKNRHSPRKNLEKKG